MEIDRTDRFARITQPRAVEPTTSTAQPDAEERRRRRTRRVQDAWLRALHHTGATDGTPPGGSLPPRPLV